MTTKKEMFSDLISTSKLVYVFIHDFPDPDSLGAALGLTKIIRDVFKKQCVIFGSGVSHPQNRTMLSVLNIELENPYEWDFQDGSEGTYIFVDFNPTSGNYDFGKRLKNKPDWVIDHHMVPPPIAENWDIQQVGSCCTIIKEYFNEFGIVLNPENPEDAEIATAMLLGIKTDTKDLLSDDTTPQDITAFEDLKIFYDTEKFNEIMNYDLPLYFFELMVEAYNNKLSSGSLSILNLGYLSAAKRDAIPYIADLWQRCKDVNAVVAFGIIDKTIHASARVRGGAHIKATEVLKTLFLYTNGEGGGHPHMAGARVPLIPFWDPEALDSEHKKEFLAIIMQMLEKRAKKLSENE